LFQIGAVQPSQTDKSSKKLSSTAARLADASANGNNNFSTAAARAKKESIAAEIIMLDMIFLIPDSRQGQSAGLTSLRIRCPRKQHAIFKSASAHSRT
jgi:hypothetical protein